MKNEREPSSLFAVLTRHFLAFTGTLLVLAAVIYGLWTHKLGVWDSGLNVDGLLASRDFAAGRYERVSAARYLGDGAAFAVLGGDLQVRYGGFGDGRSAYTEREFGFLTGSWSDRYTLCRQPFTAAGETRTLLIWLPAAGNAGAGGFLAAVNRIWFVLIPLYVLTTAWFIFRLRRKIGRPLVRLDRAIVRLREGESVNVSDCGGPAEIQRMAENVNALAAQLTESERERDRLDSERQKLIADISHDLKTPITVLAGYTSAIRDGKVPEGELNRYLEAIDSKAVSLAALINSFYEYAKTSHPEFRLTLRPVDLCEFLREYLAEKYDEIDLAGFSLDVRIPDSPVHCRLDRFQFRRALDNILSNSLQHNTLGTLIRVSLSVTAPCVVIRLSDNGNGIPASLRSRLFVPFATGDEARSGSGSGLGLAIARRIIEAHRGSIRLLPNPPGAGGSIFEILLPRIRPDETDHLKKT